MVFIESLNIDVPAKAMGSAADFVAWQTKEKKREIEEKSKEAENTITDNTTATDKSKEKEELSPDNKKASKELINNMYRLGEKLGAGAFGDIYTGYDDNTDEKVAIKMERDTSQSPQVLFEGGLYSLMDGNSAVPKCYWAGHHGIYNIMVLQVLGPSLDDLFCFCKRRFSVKTVLMIGQQMLKAIEYMHTKQYLHRDIKPNNFLMGIGEKREILYIIDFGLAKRYNDAETGEHIIEKDGKGLVGTAKFASINSHLGIELSRRDDIEAIGYMLVYFIRGSLPWQGLGARTTKQQMHQLILEKKQNTQIQDLCRIAPNEFVTFFQYALALRFAECPDYKYLRGLFKAVWKHHKFKLDYVFDWTTQADIKKLALTETFGDSLSGKSASGKKSKAKEEEVLPVKMMPRKMMWLSRDDPLHDAFQAGSFVRCRETNRKGSVIGEFLDSIVVKWKPTKTEEILKKDVIDETSDLKMTNCDSKSSSDASGKFVQQDDNSQPEHPTSLLKRLSTHLLRASFSPVEFRKKKRKHVTVKVLARSRKKTHQTMWNSWPKCMQCNPQENPRANGEIAIGEIMMNISGSGNSKPI